MIRRLAALPSGRRRRAVFRLLNLALALGLAAFALRGWS